MKKVNNKIKKELTKLLQEIEQFVNEKKVFDNIDLKNQLYVYIHKLDVAAGQYGINSISQLISPIENGMARAIEIDVEFPGNFVAIITGTINTCYLLLDDPALSNTGLKTNYDMLHKQIVKTFPEYDEKKEDSSLSSNQFQQVFIEEANDLINQLEEKLLQLESEPGDMVLVDNVFRIMHTLKGNSNMFGYEHLGEITHHLENLYDAIREQKIKIDKSILQITFGCIDHFRNLIEDQYLSEEGNMVTQKDILQSISEVLSDEVVTEEVKEKDDNISPEKKALKTIYIYFKPQPDIAEDGTNALYFIYDLFEIGDCFPVPYSGYIPTDESYNPELCYTLWHVILCTEESKENVIDNFMFLNDKNQPLVEVIADEDLLKKQGFKKKFKEHANSEQPIAQLLKEKYLKNDTSKVKSEEKERKRESVIDSIRVSSGKIDQMMNLVSELVTKQAELSMIANTHNEIDHLQEIAEHIESISRDLRDNAFSISLLPIEKTVLRFQRLVRDVSTKFNKSVEFKVEGKETELDKTIIEKIVDPIMHILRNSIDHGIEMPEDRIKAGKPEYGTINLKAFTSGAHVVIEISDDGCGINRDKVRNTAISRGYISEKEDFSTEEMLKLILSPGFSTAENISEVSGRGVGMDVVNQKIQEIRGELNIDTEENVGTTITIKLPLTISIIDSLLVEINKVFYLIPLSVVEICAEVKTPEITESGRSYLSLYNEYMPYIDLRKEFKIETERPEYQRLIVVKYKKIKVALVVDEIVGNHQAVLKNLGHAYRNQEIISGGSILGNGEIALVLDTNKLTSEFMENRQKEIEKINELNSQVKVEAG